jgi:hypothetical protein
MVNEEAITMRLNNQLAEQILIELYKKDGDIDEDF